VVQNAVNMPSLEPRGYVVLAPYISLAERMGSFKAQAARAASMPFTWSTAASCRGQDRPGAHAAIADCWRARKNVNRINAATVAEARGIRIHEEKQESHRGGGAAC